MVRIFRKKPKRNLAPGIFSLKRHPNDAGLKRDSILSAFKKSKKKDPLGVTGKKK
ncbi:MAG: hypothetical protein HN878_01610 [Candidatus Diapherotrites archaeon]|jgi:hypothetical protein|nr:hypothetical protein [Candidatus Diapherotrites archaeon]